MSESVRGAAFAVALLIAPVIAGACGPQSAAPEAPPSADPPPDPGREILRRIVRAEQELAFAGWKTAFHGPEGESRATRMRVTRVPGGDSLMEWQAGEETQSRWVYRSRHRWIDDPDLLLRNYRVEEAIEPSGTVAWRETRTVRIVGRRPGRPSLEILVDAELDLPLAETFRDHAGAVRFAWRFDDLTFDPEGVPAPAAGAEKLASPGQTEPRDDATADWTPLTVADVPAGFERVSSSSLPCGSVREYWSDGLAAFVVLQRPGDTAAAALEGELVRTSCDGRASVAGRLSGFEISVTGNVPVDELERVATGLRLRSAER